MESLLEEELLDEDSIPVSSSSSPPTPPPEARVYLSDLPTLERREKCRLCKRNVKMVLALVEYLGEGTEQFTSELTPEQIDPEAQCPRCVISSSFLHQVTRRIVMRPDKDIEEGLNQIR